MKVMQGKNEDLMHIWCSADELPVKVSSNEEDWNDHAKEVQHN